MLLRNSISSSPPGKSEEVGSIRLSAINQCENTGTKQEVPKWESQGYRLSS